MLGADPLSAGFDLAQDVYDGKMMPVPIPREDEEEPVEDGVVVTRVLATMMLLMTGELVMMMAWAMTILRFSAV